LIELRTYQRQTLCGVLTKSRFLKQDFNRSRFFGLDSWLSWVDFNLFVGSKGISSCGFTSLSLSQLLLIVVFCDVNQLINAKHMNG
jgi:hypothetical protein